MVGNDVYLRLVQSTSSLELALDAPVHFDLQVDATYSITLKRSTTVPADVVFDIIGLFQAPDSVLAALEDHAIGIVPPGSVVQSSASNLTSPGRIKPNQSLFIREMPEETATWLGERYSSMRTACETLANTFLWRFNIPTRAVSFYASNNWRWSRDEKDWFLAPGDIQLIIGFSQQSAPLANFEQPIQSLLSADRTEPLANEILREAVAHTGDARSAIIVGVAAVETSIKNTIAALAPDTGWLLENLQSPDVDKLVWQFLVTLRANTPSCDPILPSPRLRKRLKLAVETRNKLVHGAKLRPEQRELQQQSKAAALMVDLADIIRLMDMNVGHHWARAFLSAEAKQEIV